MSSMAVFMYEFIAYTPPHRCFVPECDDRTPETFFKNHTNFSIPKDENGASFCQNVMIGPQKHFSKTTQTFQSLKMRMEQVSAKCMRKKTSSAPVRVLPVVLRSVGLGCMTIHCSQTQLWLHSQWSARMSGRNQQHSLSTWLGCSLAGSHLAGLQTRWGGSQHSWYLLSFFPLVALCRLF